MAKTILDACCGGRMMWFDKHDERAVFMDKRRFVGTCCDGRSVSVDPDVLGDFEDMPFPNGSFRLVVPVKEVLALTDEKPLFGHRSGKKSLTHWICFMKGGGNG